MNRNTSLPISALPSEIGGLDEQADRSLNRKLAIGALVALGIELWMLGSDVHFLWKPPTAAVSGAKIANVQSVSHQVKVRSALQLNWTTVSSGDVLHEGDEIATIGDSSVTLRFPDGQALSLGPNSLLVLSRSRALGDRAFSVALVKGTLRQQASEFEAERGQLEIDVGTRKVIATGAAEIKIESSGSGSPVIDVGRGKVKIADMPGREIQFPGPGDAKAPVLREPANGSLIELARYGGVPIALRWSEQGSGKAEYVVEVSMSPDFAAPIFRETVKDATTASFTAEAKGIYHWRVLRVSGDKQITSRESYFSVRLKTVASPILLRPKVQRQQPVQPHSLDAPTLKRPVIHYTDEGAWLERVWRWVTIPEAEAAENPQSQPQPQSRNAPEEPAAEATAGQYRVDLEWEPVPGAKAYVLQIATDAEFAHLSAEKVLVGSKYAWHTNSAGFYYWRVAAVNADGDRGPFSAFMTFPIKGGTNTAGDETTYESYAEFDEYANQQNQRLRISYGPSYTSYYFDGTGADPMTGPAGVNYSNLSMLDWQFDYEYRLTPHYSLKAEVRTERSSVSPDAFSNPAPSQRSITQKETAIGLGVERRFFEPKYYISVEAGVRVSYISLPALSLVDLLNPNLLEFQSFGFFGAYGILGIHKPLPHDFKIGLDLGGLYQSTGNSYRAAQFADVELKKPITSTLTLGLKVDELLSAYRLGEETLGGDAHSLTFWPMIFGEISF